MGVVAEDDDFFEEDERLDDILAAYESGTPVTTVAPPPVRFLNLSLRSEPDHDVLRLDDHVGRIEVSGSRTELRDLVVPT